MKNNEKGQGTDLQKKIEERLTEELLSKETLSEIFEILSDYEEKDLIDRKNFQWKLEQSAKIHREILQKKQLMLQEKELQVQEKQLMLQEKELQVQKVAALLAALVAASVGFKEELTALINLIEKLFSVDFVDFINVIINQIM